MPAADPVTRLKVNGVEVSAPRQRGDVVLTRALLRNLDGPDELEFSEFGTLTPTYPFGSRVVLEVAFDADEDGTIQEADYVPRFAGVIVQAPRSVPGGLRVDYRCAGLKWVANDVRVTHPQSGKSEIAFNLSPADPLYEEELARLTLGEILRRVLTYDRHATDLWYAGVTAYTADPPLIDASNPSLGRAYNTAAGTGAVLKTATLQDLVGMDLVPFGEVRFTGVRLWQQIENAVEEYLPYRGVEILPDGTIRFHDTRSPTWAELRLSDSATPLELPSLGYDASETYGAVVVVGDDEVEGRSFDLATAGLVADWTAAEQAAWKLTDHTIKTNNKSAGTIPANGIGPTTVRVRPTSGALTWSANKWSVDRGYIECVLPVGPNNPTELVETRRVTGNTAVVGGESTIQLEYPLANTGYTSFRLFGQSDNPRRWVWRRYRFASAAVASRVVDVFPYEVFWEFNSGGAYVTTPQGVNFYRDTPTSSERQFPWLFDLFTDTDGVRKVLFFEPTVRAWSTQAELEAGGTSVKAPSNVLVYVPLSRGALSLRAPSAGWSGEAATNPYFRRTKYLTLTDWRFKGDESRIRQLAETTLEVVKDPVQTGSITYLGLWKQGVETPNAAVKLTNAMGLTTWDAEKLLVRGVEVAWPDAGAAVPHLTTVRVSNQRRPWAGERQYTPAAFVTGGPLSDAQAMGV